MRERFGHCWTLAKVMPAPRGQDKKIKVADLMSATFLLVRVGIEA